MNRLKGKSILLGITGSIAAYKACELIRLLRREGCEVDVVVTEAAKNFVGKTMLRALSGRPVHDSVWTDDPGTIGHIDLVTKADLILVAPATGNVIAKAANGIANDLLSDCLLARRQALMIAPAMNTFMWENPATQRNVQFLKENGVLFSGPVAGDQACGDNGRGRFKEPEQILEDIVHFFTPKLLANKKILITAGPTFEALDPVRGFTNSSSGKQGFAIAKQAYLYGADVWLVAGPCHQKTPSEVHRINVTSAQEMLSCVEAICDDVNPDLFISVAAVCDWKPTQTFDQKIKKKSDTELQVEFVRNPDILATIAQRKNGPLCIGFAAETENIQQYAQEKLQKKKLSLVVANKADAIGSDYNEAWFVESSGISALGKTTKEDLADKLIVKAAQLLANRKD